MDVLCARVHNICALGWDGARHGAKYAAIMCGVLCNKKQGGQTAAQAGLPGQMGETPNPIQRTTFC